MVVVFWIFSVWGRAFTVALYYAALECFLYIFSFTSSTQFVQQHRGKTTDCVSAFKREREKRKKEEKRLAKGLERKSDMFSRLLYRSRMKTLSIMIIFVQLLKSQMYGNSVCTETEHAGSRPISDLGQATRISVVFSNLSVKAL